MLYLVALAVHIDSITCSLIVAGSLSVRYMLMKKCWKLSPSERPCFSKLVVSLDKMLMSVAEYIELRMTLVEAEDEEGWVQHEEADDTATTGKSRSVLYAVMAFILIAWFQLMKRMVM